MAVSARPVKPLARIEWTCLLALLVVLVLAELLPPIEQPSAYHAFADLRTLGDVRNAANVLSNLGFVIAAMALAPGLSRRACAGLSRAARGALGVAAAGLLLTAAGSAYYHTAPSDTALLWDRLPMTAVFAGIAGAALAQRVSARAGSFGTPALLLLGPASLWQWHATGNLTPYVVLQVGAMVAIPLIVLLRARRDDPLAWWWLIGWYAMAKIAELLDTPIFGLTGGVVSGHTLKHVLAAVAVAGLAYPLWRPRAVAVASG